MTYSNYYEVPNSIQYFMDSSKLQLIKQQDVFGEYICKIYRNDPLSFQIKRLAGIIPHNSIICRDTGSVYKIIK